MVVAQRWRQGILTWKWPESWRSQFHALLSIRKPLDDTGSSHITHIQRTVIDAFEAFVHQHERQILNYLWRMTADEQTAFDLSQETFLRAWQQFTKIIDYDRPRAWLFHVATNLAFSHLRKHTATTIDLHLLDEDESEIISDPILHFVESDLVRQILLMLPPRRRAALILCEVYGLTFEEAAQTFETTPNALKMTLSRGREQFRRIYVREAQR